MLTFGKVCCTITSKLFDSKREVGPMGKSDRATLNQKKKNYFQNISAASTHFSLQMALHLGCFINP